MQELFFITERDDDLIGATAARDPLGVLPIRSAKGRELVPHLTEQTTQAAGFELLITNLWLWSRFEAKYPQFGSDLPAFYLVAEQAFAYATRRMVGDWPLPGRRRVMALDDEPSVDLSAHERRCHLMQNQLGNGTWGLYRSAAYRAGLLTQWMDGLSPEVAEIFEKDPPLNRNQASKLVELVREAFESEDRVATMSLHRNNTAIAQLAEIITTLPHAVLLQKKIVLEHHRTRKLAKLLLESKRSLEATGYRRFLERAEKHFPEEVDKEALRNVVRCEELIATVEQIFLWLCTKSGMSLREAASALDTDLGALREAHKRFLGSGYYPPGGPSERWHLFADRLDLSDKDTLLESLLEIHFKVAGDRGRSPWIEPDEGGRLVADIDVDSVDDGPFVPGAVWTNSYYLSALESVAGRLEECL